VEPRILQDIGLTDGEARVYLALLALGESKTGPLAKEARVSSSKVYKILDRLMVKGLTGFVTKGKTKYFSAVDPQRLREFVARQEQELERRRTVVERLIPELETAQNLARKPDAVVYDGFKATTNFFRSLLEELGNGDEYRVLGGNYGTTQGLRPFFQNYHRQRAAKGIKVRMLANHGVLGNIESTTLQQAEVRYLPERFVSSMQVTFYGSKAFITFWTRSPTGFLINDPEAVSSFGSYFDALWLMGEK